MCKITVLCHTVVFTNQLMDLHYICYLILQSSEFGSGLESLIRVMRRTADYVIMLLIFDPSKELIF
jgi:hypothetical protein